MGFTGLAPAVLAAALIAAPAAAPPNDRAPPAPIFTRQTLFSVPFRLDGSDSASRDVAEVQLHVSTNRGASWRIYNRAEPQRGSFLFRAGGDGEFWFLLRTVDRTGQVRPQTADRPGLKVIVDTTPPQMTLEARPGQSNQVVARWQITDPNLSPQTLRIQFRTGPYQPWQPVAIDRQRTSGSGPVYSGEVAWLVQEAFERLEVRGEVADLAGNTAVSHAQVRSGDLASGSPPGALKLNPPAPRPVPPLAGPQDASAGQSAPRAAESPVAIQIHPASTGRNASLSPTGTGPLPGVPLGQPFRIVNSLRLELVYELESPSASGSASVELWGTRDGGQTWQNLGRGEDRRSPFVVSVPGEGVYGFRLLRRDAAGSGEPPPSAGSPAELWVGVDLTKPQVRIVAVKQLAGPQSGQLDIRWEADDWMLAPRGVSLSYGPGQNGPWTPIATGLENTGRYTWWMDGRVPQRVYLRLEARDEAGNVGVYVSPEAVSIEPRHVPLRIRDVQPAAPPSPVKPVR